MRNKIKKDREKVEEKERKKLTKRIGKDNTMN